MMSTLQDERFYFSVAGAIHKENFKFRLFFWDAIFAYKMYSVAMLLDHNESNVPVACDFLNQFLNEIKFGVAFNKNSNLFHS
ncbi:hypothetical protein BLAT2472_30360 [Burkholderia latens]